MLSLAAKIGTGVSVLDTAGVDCDGLNALAALYDGYEKVGHDGSIDADEGMSAALARHQTSLDEQAAELQLNESQRYLEEAQEEGSAVQAQVGQGYQKLLQLLAAHPEVKELFGDNSFTPLVGLSVGLLHAYGVVVSTELPWWGLLLLGYTMGAWCKMIQFAVCHEVCHKMAGAIRTQVREFLKGFYEIMPRSLISIFDDAELELLISGLPDIDGADHAREQQHQCTASASRKQ